jgi:3-isopropylmalate/(R)-2-methylmalate dehydratase small subunit
MPFRVIEAVAAPLPLTNVDTDKILPARFLKTVTRNGLGRALFADMRREPGFVLDRTPWNRSQILIAGANFGCGSSREHAPWALLDFGIRCVIAPGFADIFHNNCFKNGILPVVLPEAAVGVLLQAAAHPDRATLSVDLPSQTVASAVGHWTFEIDPARKADLLAGVDEIARALSLAAQIAAHERKARAAAPWNRPIALDPYRRDGCIVAAGDPSPHFYVDGDRSTGQAEIEVIE